MDNWLANRVGDVDSLHVEIDNLNDLLVGFCFIRSIDINLELDFYSMWAKPVLEFLFNKRVVIYYLLSGLEVSLGRRPCM
jgi:hypothetical protein